MGQQIRVHLALLEDLISDPSPHIGLQITLTLRHLEPSAGLDCTYMVHACVHTHKHTPTYKQKMNL